MSTLTDSNTWLVHATVAPFVIAEYSPRLREEVIRIVMATSASEADTKFRAAITDAEVVEITITAVIS